MRRLRAAGRPRGNLVEALKAEWPGPPAGKALELRSLTVHVRLNARGYTVPAALPDGPSLRGD